MYLSFYKSIVLSLLFLTVSLFQHVVCCALKASVWDLFAFLLSTFPMGFVFSSCLEEQVKNFKELYHYEENIGKTGNLGPKAP